MTQDDGSAQVDERHRSLKPWKSLPGSILWPALQVGVFSGTSGLVVGGVSGLVRSTNPALFAAASGIQWFVLGSTFWATRGMILHTWDGQKIGTRDRVYASGIAGGFAGGSTAALTRGRANVVPGIIMFSLFGLIGQVVFNRVDAKHSASESVGLDNASHAESIGRRLAKSRWTPVKVLSDEEYESMLRERLLRVNAEIAIIDEDIEKLRNMPDSVEAAGIHGTKRP